MMIIYDKDTKKEYVKVLDFGESHKLPKDNSSDILTVNRTGSPFYMAPEIKRLREKD